MAGYGWVGSPPPWESGLWSGRMLQPKDKQMALIAPEGNKMSHQSPETFTMKELQEHLAKIRTEMLARNGAASMHLSLKGMAAEGKVDILTSILQVNIRIPIDVAIELVAAEYRLRAKEYKEMCALINLEPEPVPEE